MLLAAGTDHVLDYSKSYKGSDPHAAVSRTIAAAVRCRYESMKADHIVDYQRMFRRVTSSLGRTANADLPTHQRLARLMQEQEDPALIDQYGRYLLISSSRAGNPLPGRCA